MYFSTSKTTLLQQKDKFNDWIYKFYGVTSNPKTTVGLRLGKVTFINKVGRNQNKAEVLETHSNLFLFFKMADFQQLVFALTEKYQDFSSNQPFFLTFTSSVR